MEKKNEYKDLIFKDDELELEVNIYPHENTIWLTQEKISILFGKARNTIAEYINKIYKAKELDELSTCRKKRQVHFEGLRKVEREIKEYNLEVIFLIGYKIKSKRLLSFKQWIDTILAEQNNENKYEIVKFINNELELEVNIDTKDETVWLTQDQLALLFNTTKQNISLHVNNIINEGELEVATVKDYLTVRFEGNRKVTRKIKSTLEMFLMY